jgi:hypothetical protein
MSLLFKIHLNIVLVSVTSFQILLLQFLQFLLFQQPGQLSRNPGGGKSYFLLQNVRSTSWAHPGSYSMDVGVKHLGREVYHSSPPSAQVMNEWGCISTSPISLHGVDWDLLKSNALIAFKLPLN